MSQSYLFTSDRLGFRNWQPADFSPFAAMNADPEVMRFFPGILSPDESYAFALKMQAQFEEKAYCYFAVETLKDQKFIGFIGISEKNFEASFTPCHDIGWRLAQSAWGRGYATEGAQRCLKFAFKDLKLEKVYAMAPRVNLASIKIMEKIGMQKVQDFLHPLLTHAPQLEACVLYVIYKA